MATSTSEQSGAPAVAFARAALALLCVVLVFFAFPAGYWFVGFPAVLLGASFWRPQVATYGLAALVAVFVVASLLNA